MAYRLVRACTTVIHGGLKPVVIDCLLAAAVLVDSAGHSALPLDAAGLCHSTHLPTDSAHTHTHTYTHVACIASGLG